MEAMLSKKDLLKLAKACRAAGILTFKGYGVEFTLTPDAPAPARNATRGVSSAADAANASFETDTMDAQQLLYWSVGTADEVGKE